MQYQYCASFGTTCNDWKTDWREEVVCRGRGGGGGGGGPGSGGGPGAGCDPNAIDPGPGCERPDDPEPCNTGDRVIDDIAAQVGPQWEASNAADPNPFARLEQGGWITRDPQSGRHALVPFPASWRRTVCSIKFPQDGFDVPNNAVGMFHTHPFAVGDTDEYLACKFQTLSEGPLGSLSRSDLMRTAERLAQKNPYRGLPSNDDVNFISSLRELGADLFGVIADKNGYVRYNADTDPDAPRSALQSYAPCEYDPNA